MLRSVPLALVAMAVSGGVLCAQGQNRVDTLGDSTRVTTISFHELFRGMDLTDQEQVRAKAVILDAYKTVMNLPEAGGCAKFEHWKAVIAKRDSVLLTLVHSEADSARLRERAAPQGPRGPCPYPHGH